MAMEYLLYLVGSTIMGLIYAWPITIILVSVLILTAIHNSPFTHKDYKRSYLAFLLPSLLTIFILLFPWSGVIQLYLVVAHVPVITLLAKRFWQYQWFVVTLGVFQMWVSLVAAFVQYLYFFWIMSDVSFD